MRELKVGTMYWQKSCEKWLKYDGFGATQPGWHDFSENGKLYNQLRSNEVEQMFDFTKSYSEK